MLKSNTANDRSGLRSFWTVGIVVAIASIVLIFIWLKVVRGKEDPTSNLATFVV